MFKLKKQHKLQRFHEQGQINREKQNMLRHESNRLVKKRGEILKGKMVLKQ
jgi:hypothetical protein